MKELGTTNQISDRGGIFKVGKYRVSLAAREVFLGEQRIKLSWRCFEAMELLVAAKAGIVVSGPRNAKTGFRPSPE